MDGNLWKAGPRSAFAGIIVGLGLGPTLWVAALQERSIVLPNVAYINAGIGLIFAGVVGAVWAALLAQFLMHRPRSRRGRLALAGVLGFVIGLGLGLGYWLALLSLPVA